MKKTFSPFLMMFYLAMILLPSHLVAEPVVSYIIPDIGSPGMATYMEIISAYNGNGNFGQDRKIDNPMTNEQLKIEFKNPADANKITFSPLVISWNGRMIATTVFVNPDLEMPETSDYRDLANKYVIQFRVNMAGAVSEWQTFYIVKPYQFPDLSDNNTDYTFGEGALGVRSPRGAMIVEKLSLNNARHYSVSIKDCDPNTPGNQAYLPFVLMVKEDIIGKKSGGKNSMIDISANGKHAGAGGGGGGGYFTDSFITGFKHPGEDGGDGFVGGGPGGQNKAAFPMWADSYKNWGEGTGENNGSLNGVPRPVTVGHESGGGGTGHPFGFSGKGAFGNNVDATNNAGGYGGGSGGSQNSIGGGGGYSTNGSQSNKYNAGKAHGNRLGVPIAGGSGGASGNPNYPGDKSGSGGGGGGAIRIFAKTVKNLIILANGSKGDNGDKNTHGGGGSGGYIGLFTKILAENIETSNVGGTAGNDVTKKGGLGRLRLDLFKEDEIIIPEEVRSVGEAMFFGFASDTTNLVSRKCFVSGRKGKDNKLTFYYKAQSESSWKIAGTANADNTEWTQALKLTGTDSVYYFVALNIPAGSGTEEVYKNTPLYDYSQAAYNILKIDKFPEIEAEKNLHIVEPKCEGNEYKIVTKIKNKGDAPLELNFSKARFANGGIFESNQTNDMLLQPGKSIDIVFTLKTKIEGVYEDEYIFTHNDKIAEQYPEWTINLKYELKEYDAEFRDENNKAIDTLDLGVICLGNDYKPTEQNITIANTSAQAIEIGSIKLKEVNNSFTINIPNKSIEKGSSTNAQVFFNATEPGTYTQTAYIQLRDCPELKDTIVLKAHLERPAIIIPEEPDFGKICNNDIRKFGIRIENPTPLEYDLSAMKLETEMPGITLALSDNNTTMKQKSSKEIEVTIDGSKFSKGLHQVAIVFPGASCADIGNVKLVFEIIGDNLFTEYTKDNPLDMGVVLINNSTSGKLTMQLGDDKSLSYEIVSISNVNAPFSVVSTNPKLPFILNKGNSLTVDIKFSPTQKGDYRDSIVVISKASGDMCADTLSMHFVASAVEKQTSDIDFGKVLSCKTKEKIIYLKNSIDSDINVINLIMTGNNPDHFSVVNLDPDKSFILKKDETKEIVVRYTPEPYTAGNLTHTAELQAVISEIPVNIVFKLRAEVEVPNVSFKLADGADLSEGEVGDVRNLNVVITNHNSVPAKAILSSTNTNVTLPNTPMMIGAGETKVVPFTCTITEKGSNEYLISLMIEEPCEVGATVSFKINTKAKGKFIVRLKVPELKDQDPRNRNLQIPVYARFENLTGEDVKILTDIEFDLRLNATMYYANRISNGEITSSIDGSDRVLSIKLKDIPADPEEKVICTILGSALLGDDDSTAITFDNIKFSIDKMISELDTTNGSLKYIICEEGGDRLIHYKEPLSMKISPNPASDVLQLELTAFEMGKHTVELVNPLGESESIVAFDYDPASPQVVNASIGLSNYANGTYLLIFRGPNRLITKQLIIIK